MSSRLAFGAAFSLLLLGSAPALADETKACVAASDQAQQLRDEGKLKDAREQMLLCARDVCPGAVRKDCSAWLTALEASLPSVVIGAQDAKHNDLIRVTVTLDGKPLLTSLDGRAMAIDPGPHKLRAEAEGQTPVEQTVLIREGEQRRVISIQFPAPGGAAPVAPVEKAGPKVPETPAPPETTPAPTRVPVASVVVAGIGVLGLGSFAYFGITGKSDLSKLRDSCGVTHTCPQADVDATHNKLLVADISLAASVLALGVATGLFFAGRHAPAKKAAAALQVGGFPLGKGAGAAVSGTF